MTRSHRPARPRRRAVPALSQTRIDTLLAGQPSPQLGHDPSHRGSHTSLLNHIDAAGARTADFDALIVPTNRPVAKYLRDATTLASELGCLLVPICSGEATAQEAAALGDELAAPVAAIDATHASGLLPWFETSALLADPSYKVFAHTSDLSLKRNLGLVLARAAGWRRVLFLDDDIAHERLDDLRAAAGLLDGQDVVGLRNTGFADNSVVCHAYRDLGGNQETFIGGGAMAVAPRRVRTFFPNIYSEDWFFLHRALKSRRVAVTGSVSQKKYDPYASPRRAEAEEFGDCLAEGLYCLLDDGFDERAADAEFWQRFIGNRRGLIKQILSQARQLPDRRIVDSLEAARHVNSFITHTLCLEYLRAWSEDQRQWLRYLGSVPIGSSIDAGLAALGLAGRAVRSAHAERALAKV